MTKLLYVSFDVELEELTVRDASRIKREVEKLLKAHFDNPKVFTSVQITDKIVKVV